MTPFARVLVLGSVAIAGLVATTRTAHAWYSYDHYGITIEECDRTRLRKPAGTTNARWTSLLAWVNNSARWSRPFDGEVCDWFARTSRLADSDIFDKDEAHSQTAYTGGINWLNGQQIFSHNQTTRFDDPRYGLTWTSTFTAANTPSDLIVERPSVTIPKFVTYFMARWGEVTTGLTAIKNAGAPVKQVNEYKRRNNGCDDLVAKSYELKAQGWTDVNEPGADQRWMISLGHMLHQFQDSCTHQGITGAQHAYLAYGGGGNRNPDDQRGTRLETCTRQLTRAFFDQLAQVVADWGADVRPDRDASIITYIELTDWSQIRMGYDGQWSRANVSMAPRMTGATGDAITDYWFQMCDETCRDADTSTNGAVIRNCQDYRMNNKMLYDFWSDLFSKFTSPTFNAGAFKNDWGGRAQASWYAADTTGAAGWDAQPQATVRRFPNGVVYGGAIFSPNQSCPRVTNRAVAYKWDWGWDTTEANWICNENGDPSFFPGKWWNAAGTSPVTDVTAAVNARLNSAVRGRGRTALNFDNACYPLRTTGL